ncbi:putative Leukocyte elastase inhibitor C [Hypsibius exemplaris]|uniref:Leukocyte elastase inhibitor C n=1 Tax=Hypsibius exemplaris TaxID=2072580 RepID=A0A9X6NCR0_HYPEX|nr:putative Leukocyte elastase inhibitor C [Hypsibius exemplaris]
MVDPLSSPQDLQALNNLALRLYRELVQSAGKNSKGNLVFSPTILLISLQQACLASQGKTREQLQKLGKIPDESLRAVLHDLEVILQAGHVSRKDRQYDFFAATKILVSQGISVSPRFAEELKSLQAGNKDVVTPVQADLKATESLINEFAKVATEERIQTFATEQALAMDKDSLLLLSLGHFRSDWEDKFVKRTSVNYEGRQMRATLQALPGTMEDFHNLDGTAAKVIMVHLEGKIFLTRDEKLKVTIAELPLSQYDNNFVIVLPDDAKKHGLKDFEDAFKEDTFEILRQHWQMPLTHVYLPKFSLENHFSLNKPLQDLGVKDIFSPAKADLSGISAATGLHVSDVLHAASIDISCETSKGLPPYQPRAGECSGALMPDTFATGFHVNRPFFFLVRPRHPEMWNVMGRVVHLDEEVDRTVWNHHKHEPTDE